MLTTKLTRHLALLLLGAAVLICGAAMAQDKEAEESDQAFLSRMEREMNTLKGRADNVERWVRQKMGMSNATGYRAGVSATATPGRTATNPMDSELRRMRLELRSMKKKIDKEMPPYKILGACNPHLADQAISAVPDIGLLLPCNVLVREDDAGQVSVGFMDPEAVMGLVENPGVEPLASEVRKKLERVLDAL